MLKKDKVFPEEFNYSVVIGALGRAGQAEKAFRLYRGMRERGLQPSAACYTGLFNSVAESQNSMNLKRAISLYSKLHRNKIRMSRITYNSLMKAFGRHGTTEQMMGIFRESLVAGFEPDVETFNTIILCMKRDRDAGFRKAIEVWRQMIMLDIKPNGKSVVHLLQVLKNCGIGDADEAYRKLIKELPEPGEYKDYFTKYIRNVYWLKGQKSTSKNETLRQIPSEPEILTIEPGSVYEADFDKINNEDDTKTKIGEAAGTDGISDISKCGSELPQHQEVKVVANVDDITMSNQLTNSPNLLDLPFTKEKGHETAIFQIKKELRATDRLELIGGYQHIFDVMEKYEIQPTKMVLSALAWVLPSNRVAENDVIEYSTKHRVQLDTDFFNSILRKQVARQDFSGMHEILEKMVSIGLTPNYRTWCIMALSCQKGVQGVTLINEIKSKEVELNEIFFKSLISAALRRKTEPIKGYQDVKGYDYRYLGRILREMKELGIKADQQMIVMLETASDWPEGYERVLTLLIPLIISKQV